MFSGDFLIFSLFYSNQQKVQKCFQDGIDDILRLLPQSSLFWRGYDGWGLEYLFTLGCYVLLCFIVGKVEYGYGCVH